MRESFCLLLFILHFNEGCNVKDQLKTITGYTGGSVLLPCSCKDSQSKPETGFTWKYFNKAQQKWIDVFKDEKYKSRLKLFDQSSPANLTLLISDLRKEDEGAYSCEISFTIYRSFRVTIEGCDLDQNKQTLQVTGHPGEPVVLPCSCTELQAKPQQLTWTFTPLNHSTKPEEIYPNKESKQHTGRVKLLNEISPRNLSLHISNLKKEDEGEYHCSELQKNVNIILSVQVGTTSEPIKHTEESTTEQSEDNSIKSQKPTSEQSEDNLGTQLFIPLSVFPALSLLALLALIYWKCRGRRNVQQMTNDGLELDEVTYSSVVHVRTAAKAHKQIIMTEDSEYASIK